MSTTRVLARNYFKELRLEVKSQTRTPYGYYDETRETIKNFSKKPLRNNKKIK